MAPRALMVRWRKAKAKRRREAPKAFATKASAGFTKHVMRTEQMYKGHDRISSSPQIARLEHYIKRMKPHHIILFNLFKPALTQASQALASDPKMSVELLLERYIAMDPALSVFRYNVVVLEQSDFHSVSLHFSGPKCFLVYMKRNWVKVSMEYSSTEILKSLPLSKVAWAGEPIYLDLDSSEL